MTAAPPSPFVVPGIDRALPPAARVREAYRRIAAADRPEVWITLRPETDVLAEAEAVQRRLDAGQRPALAGLLVAVKDNIDVAGMPTTAACPEYAYRPDTGATAVERLRAAGALVLGKTNLDQFATGLVGTRSPYGAVRCAWDPARVSGGSSSGSAVAVALGIADLGIGTDTAGSGRVPAAFQGIVGIKATPGIVPVTGIVPACADYDCVAVLAADLTTAHRALTVMAGPDGRDPRGRDWPADVHLAAPARPRVAVPRPADLTALTPGYLAAFAIAVERLAGIAEPVEVDVTGLLQTATLLYDGALVAERHAAVGQFLASRPAGADPVVAAIVGAAADVTGPQFAADVDAVVRARHLAQEVLADTDALLLPVTTEHPTIAAIAEDPVGINRRLGTFTNFANLLDMATVAVPAGEADGGPFGVMFVAGSMRDHVALDLAARWTGDRLCPPTDAVELLVVGSQLAGELDAVGARFLTEVATSAAYRLVVLPGEPERSALVHRGRGGEPVAGQLWAVSPGGLGQLLTALRAPLSLGPVELADGRLVTGLACAAEPAALGSHPG
ncbi:allophanate hydrolase [Pseudonocardia thermophila]|jgi:allophanate hydrolase|uniref:Allophanate hydrolase n=1 Tax=Pseudonocardia thermophila TaxID=1848 RepID=A0A1M7AK06_PSETH|nr:allophanate hydrolase [Pseudonocardia thermophila]SHL43058.1 allophanate hydrolase [Pseudonocardia thermophila]